jgi:hypothetical protein
MQNSISHLVRTVGVRLTLVNKVYDSRFERLREQFACALIEACIANARRATNGSPDPLAFAFESPNISCAGINRTRPPQRLCVPEQLTSVCPTAHREAPFPES